MLSDVTSGKEGAFAMGVQIPDATPSFITSTHVAPSMQASAAVSNVALQSRQMCTTKHAFKSSNKGCCFSDLQWATTDRQH